MSTDKNITARAGKQISVFVENEVGALSKAAHLLGEHDINIYALTLTGGLQHGYIRLVADKHEEAMNVLKAAGYLIYDRDVVLLEVDNAPGALASITDKWKKAGVNIDYAYCAGGPAVERGLVIVKVDDVEKALGSL